MIPAAAGSETADEDTKRNTVSVILNNEVSSEPDEDEPGAITGEAVSLGETTDQENNTAHMASPLYRAPSEGKGNSGDLSTTITWKLDDDGTLILSGSGEYTSFETVPWSGYEDKIKKIVIEEGIKGLREGTFSYCINLTSVSLPEGYKYILSGTFYKCKVLNEINFPNSLEYIASDAFDPDNSAVLSKLPSYLSEDDEGNYAILYDVPVTVKYGQTEARKMLDLVNNFRTSGSAWYWESESTKKTNIKKPALKYDYGLEQIAMQRAAEIAYSFDHVRPCASGYGNGSFNSCKASDGTTSSAENIAGMYGTPNMQKVFDMWKEENEGFGMQGHRLNMLGNFKTIGIGCAVVNGNCYWVMELGYDASSIQNTYAADSDKKMHIKITPDAVGYYNEYVNGTLRQPLFVEYEYKKNILHVLLQNAWPESQFLALEGDYLWETGDPQIAEIKGDLVRGVSEGETTLNYYYQFKAPVYIGLSAKLRICKPGYQVTGKNRYATCAFTAAISFPEGADEVIMVTATISRTHFRLLHMREQKTARC